MTIEFQGQIAIVRCNGVVVAHAIPEIRSDGSQTDCWLVCFVNNDTIWHTEDINWLQEQLKKNLMPSKEKK